MSDKPKVESFCINPVGGSNISVEGSSRFVHERDFDAYRDWAEKQLAERDAQIAHLRAELAEHKECMGRAEVEALLAAKLPCGHPEACAIMHDPQGARMSCGWCEEKKKLRIAQEVIRKEIRRIQSGVGGATLGEMEEVVKDAIPASPPSISLEKIDGTKDSYKLYAGRDTMHHGMWKCTLSDFDAHGEEFRAWLLEKLNSP